MRQPALEAGGGDGHHGGPWLKESIEMTVISRARYLAHGAAHAKPAYETPITCITFVLVPLLTKLAFASVIEPFRLTNQLAGKRLFVWKLRSLDGESVTGSNGIALMPDGPMPREMTEGYILVCGDVNPERTIPRSLGDWIVAQWHRNCVAGRICKTAYALARAEVQLDQRFTLRWKNLPGFRKIFPELEPMRQIFCTDDRFLSCAGDVAATDLTVSLVTRHCDRSLARSIMETRLLSNNCAVSETQGSSIASRQATRNAAVIRATEHLEKKFESEFDLSACARHTKLVTTSSGFDAMPAPQCISSKTDLTNRRRRWKSQHQMQPDRGRDPYHFVTGIRPNLGTFARSIKHNTIVFDDRYSLRRGFQIA